MSEHLRRFVPVLEANAFSGCQTHCSLVRIALTDFWDGDQEILNGLTERQSFVSSGSQTKKKLSDSSSFRYFMARVSLVVIVLLSKYKNACVILDLSFHMTKEDIVRFTCLFVEGPQKEEQEGFSPLEHRRNVCPKKARNHQWKTTGSEHRIAWQFPTRKIQHERKDVWNWTSQEIVGVVGELSRGKRKRKRNLPIFFLSSRTGLGICMNDFSVVSCLRSNFAVNSSHFRRSKKAGWKRKQWQNQIIFPQIRPDNNQKKMSKVEV